MATTENEKRWGKMREKLINNTAKEFYCKCLDKFDITVWKDWERLRKRRRKRSGRNG